MILSTQHPLSRPLFLCSAMQPNDPTTTDNGLSTPAQFRAKLGSYLTGVIIGFTLLGLIYFMKHLATQGQPAPGTVPPIPTEMETTP